MRDHQSTASGQPHVAARVLAIDDNGLLLQTCRQVLAAPPAFAVDLAPSGPEGLALVRRACAEGAPYALAFIDIRMPQWDGIRTAEALWQADPDLQVVFCTAFSDYAWGELAARLGRTDRWLVLKKPFDAIEMQQLSSALAAKSRLQRAQRRQVDQLEQQVEARVLELRQANRTLQVIARCHDALARSRSETELLDTLCQRLVEDGRYLLARMGLAEQAGAVAQAGLPQVAAPPWCDDVQRLVLRDARSLVTRYADCGATPGNAVAAAVALPLRHHADVLGTLCLYAAAIDAFDDEELRQLQELADEIAGGIASLRNAQARAHAERERGCQANDDAVIQAELHRALEGGELLLYYQPKVDLRSGRAAGAEAVLHWQHPQRGLVMLEEFMGQAEESGMILPFASWVIDAVCRQIRQWIGAGLPVLPIAVNLSARQFRQKDLVAVVRNAMQRHSVDPQWIELEVTESALMEQLDAATAALRELKATGVRLTLDDFGAGYSSLSHLQRFPVDYVKIDRAFVREAAANPSDASICRSLIDLAHALRLHVIAEGVETEGQVRYLRQHRCDELQGHYFSHALPAAEFEQVLRGRITWQMPRAHNALERTLLLVDDEPNILSALRRLCRSEGYTVLTADNAQAALELMATRQVQVVLSDQRMPNMNGTEFLSRARALQPDTIRMLLTGYTELELVIQAINQGTLFKFLTKPWDDGAMLAHLREAFDYHEMRARATA